MNVRKTCMFGCKKRKRSFFFLVYFTMENSAIDLLNTMVANSSNVFNKNVIFEGKVTVSGDINSKIKTSIKEKNVEQKLFDFNDKKTEMKSKISVKNVASLDSNKYEI